MKLDRALLEIGNQLFLTIQPTAVVDEKEVVSRFQNPSKPTLEPQHPGVGVVLDEVGPGHVGREVGVGPELVGRGLKFAFRQLDVVSFRSNLETQVGVGLPRETELELAKRYRLIATPALVIDRDTVMYGVPRLATLAARVDASRPGASSDGRSR